MRALHQAPSERVPEHCRVQLMSFDAFFPEVLASLRHCLYCIPPASPPNPLYLLNLDIKNPRPEQIVAQDPSAFALAAWVETEVRRQVRQASSCHVETDDGIMSPES